MPSGARRQPRRRQRPAKVGLYRSEQKLTDHLAVLKRTSPSLSESVPTIGSLFRSGLSLDGSLDNTEESLRAAASCCSRREFSLPNRSTSARSRALSSRSCRFSARSPAFSASRDSILTIPAKSCSSILTTPWATPSSLQSPLGSRGFKGQADTHPWLPDRDRSAARQTEESWAKRIPANSLRGLTSRIPLFKITLAGPLPWGSGGHDGSENPVNNYRKLMLRRSTT